MFSYIIIPSTVPIIHILYIYCLLSIPIDKTNFYDPTIFCNFKINRYVLYILKNTCMSKSIFSEDVVNLFEWSDKYKIGIEEIDNQHKTLFSIAFDLNKAMLERRSNDILKELLDKLIDYTQTHTNN